MENCATPKVYKGSGKTCAVFGCSNSQRKRRMWLDDLCNIHLGLNHNDCACLVPFSLHSFPKNGELRHLWIAALNRKDFEPSKHSRVCSIHFLDQGPSKENPTPQLNLGYPKKVIRGRQPLKRAHHLNIIVPENVMNEESRPSQEEDIDEVRPESPAVIVEVQPNSRNSCRCTETRETREIGTQWEDLSLQDHKYYRVTPRNTKSVSTQVDNPDISFVNLNNTDSLFYTGLQIQVFFDITNHFSSSSQVLSIQNGNWKSVTFSNDETSPRPPF